MSQFTESQLATIRVAVEFLAETQRSHHAHVTAEVQELLALFNPVAEAPAEVPAVEEVAEEEVQEVEAVEAEETEAE